MTCNFSFWLISSWMEGKARQLKSTGISELLWIKMVFCVLNASRPQDVGGLMGVDGCDLFDTSKVEQETTKIQLKVLWRYLPTATGWPVQFVRLNTKRSKERFFCGRGMASSVKSISGLFEWQIHDVLAVCVPSKFNHPYIPFGHFRSCQFWSLIPVPSTDNPQMLTLMLTRSREGDIDIPQVNSKNQQPVKLHSSSPSETWNMNNIKQ